MRIKSWLPLFFVLGGTIFLAIGIWQMTNVKIKTGETLNKAKQLVEDQPVNAASKSNGTISKPSGIGDTIGILTIPTIHAELPIIEGTNPDELEKGVGHYKGSSFPGENGQIVLSGHRDTVFRRLGELKIGDTFIFKMPNGTYTYKITHTKIVGSKDTSIITLQNNEEELILTTCYPFSFIGNAPKRYIIYASPI